MRRGFSLIELLVVIAILAVILALSVSTFSGCKTVTSPETSATFTGTVTNNRNTREDGEIYTYVTVQPDDRKAPAEEFTLEPNLVASPGIRYAFRIWGEVASPPRHISEAIPLP